MCPKSLTFSEAARYHERHAVAVDLRSLSNKCRYSPFACMSGSGSSVVASSAYTTASRLTTALDCSCLAFANGPNLETRELECNQLLKVLFMMAQNGRCRVEHQAFITIAFY